jgi:hypothetical protein
MLPLTPARFSLLLREGDSEAALRAYSSLYSAWLNTQSEDVIEADPEDADLVRLCAISPHVGYGRRTDAARTKVRLVHYTAEGVTTQGHPVTVALAGEDFPLFQAAGIDLSKGAAARFPVDLLIRVKPDGYRRLRVKEMQMRDGSWMQAASEQKPQRWMTDPTTGIHHIQGWKLSVGDVIQLPCGYKQYEGAIWRVNKINALNVTLEDTATGSIRETRIQPGDWYGFIQRS